MSALPPIILYTYPASPFGQKVELVLLLKRLPYSKVKVPMQPPRTALELLGITYRKIPVLAIGNDVYFDTALASLALDRVTSSYPLLSPSTEGIQRALSFYWGDRAIFSLAPALLDWDKFPESFIKDRESFGSGSGGKIDPKKMIEGRDGALSALRGHLDLVERQLAARTSTNNYILNTPTPTYLDVSIYFVLNWVSQMPPAANLFISHRITRSYITLFTSHITSLRSSFPKIPFLSADEAAKIIHSSPASSVPNDVHEPLIVNKTFVIGDLVEVTPNDTGRVAQRGTLKGFGEGVVVVEVDGKGGKCRVWAPRLGFVVRKVKGGNGKL